VQQRRQPQHQVRTVLLERDGPLQDLQGVVVDVLVLVPLVDLEPQRGQLRQDGEAELAGEASGTQLRNGSSPKESSGRPGVRNRCAARSSSPPYGSTKAPAARQSGRAMAIALTAKSRRARSSSSESP
jgi:hypothetical protein